MVIKAVPRNYTKPTWDIFDTFTDMPKAKQANIEMKALCDKFASDYTRLSNKYSKEGLADSASRDMVVRYVLEKLEPWRKKWRAESEKGITRPYHK
jgi:hypothetical protein